MCKPCTRHDQCSTQVCVKDETLNVSSVPAAMRLKTGDCVKSDGILLVDVNCTSCGNLQTQINAASIDKPYVLVKTYDEKTPINVLPKVGLPELHIVTSTADSSPALLTQAPPATMHYQNMTTPHIATRRPAACPASTVCLIMRSTAGCKGWYR